MREKGWLYCSGLISDCCGSGTGKSITGWEYYSCRQRTEKAHWHKVYEMEEGKTVIDWDVMYDEIDGKDTRIGHSLSKPEQAEREYCASHHLCMSCKEPLQGDRESENWHTPYWIPRCHGYYWCTKCYGNRNWHPGHAYCPHNKDPHRHDAENEHIRKWNESHKKESIKDVLDRLEKERDGVEIPVNIVKKEYCDCPLREGVVSSPIDTVETCKYCGKIIEGENE